MPARFWGSHPERMKAEEISPPRRVAVVGSGVAGVSVAYLLNRCKTLFGVACQLLHDLQHSRNAVCWSTQPIERGVTNLVT